MALPEKTSQHLSLHWDKCQANLLSSFEKLLNFEQFVDVTLAVESETIKCHKVVLSASSAYFEKILLENPCSHPVIIMQEMKYWEVMALVKFMYRGEVMVEEEKLESLLKCAETLQIRGLATDNSADGSVESEDSMDVKDVSDSGQQSAVSEHVQSGQLNNKMRRKIMASESECTSPNINTKLKKAYYRNSLPSFKTSSTNLSSGVMSDTPLMPFVRPDENVMIKEEVDIEYFHNPEEVTVNPSVEYAVLQGEEVNLEGPLSQIMASDPGPSSSLDPQSKGSIEEEQTPHLLEHLPRRLDRQCNVCTTRNKKKRTYWWCPGCNCGVHPQCFPKLEHYYRPRGSRRSFPVGWSF